MTKSQKYTFKTFKGISTDFFKRVLINNFTLKAVNQHDRPVYMTFT